MLIRSVMCSSSNSPTISSITSSSVISRPRIRSSSSRTRAISRFALRNSRRALSRRFVGLQKQCKRIDCVLKDHNSTQKAKEIKQVFRVDDTDNVVDIVFINGHACVSDGAAPHQVPCQAAYAAPGRPSYPAAPCTGRRACPTTRTPFGPAQPSYPRRDARLFSVFNQAATPHRCAFLSRRRLETEAARMELPVRFMSQMIGRLTAAK